MLLRTPAVLTAIILGILPMLVQVAAPFQGYAQRGDTLRLLATTHLLADLAQQVAGQRQQVHSLLPSGADPHRYEPLPADMQRLAQADLIFLNGLGLEVWVSRMQQAVNNQKKIVWLSEGIPAITAPGHASTPDPHAWMTAPNGKTYADNVCRALCRMDPTGTAYYQQRLLRFHALLDSIDAVVRAQIQRIPPPQRVLVATHDAFQYFGQTYGIQLHSALGVSTEAQVRSQDLQRLYAIVRETKVPAVFVEAGLSPKLMQQLSEDMGVQLGGQLYADVLGPPGSGADTYTGMLLSNALTLAQSLQRQPQASTGWTPPGTGSLLGLAALLLLSVAALAWKLWPPKPEARQGPQIVVEGVSVIYGTHKALANINLTIEPGYVYGLLGPNGSGKSTLLKVLMGLQQPASGHVRYNGKPIAGFRSQLAYVPQREEIDWQFPATVWDVVLMGRYADKRPFQQLDAQDMQLAADALDMVKLGKHKHRQISQLSGGQQQRMFFARALAQQASILVLDEPFVGIDQKTEASIMTILQNLAAQGKTLIVIHHDLAKVPQYFDRVVLLNQRLIACGPTAEVFTPDNIAKTFGGQLTLLHEAAAQRAQGQV